MKTSELMKVYLESVCQKQIITEGVFDKIKEKVMGVFNCFNKVNELSNNISSGNFDGDCNKLAEDSKGALSDITSSISLLKKPTDALVNVGTDKIGPLFKGPIGTAKNGGDLNKSVSKMLDNTKKIFGSSAQDALKGSASQNQVSQEVQQKVNKKFNLFLESRCFHRKQSHTLRHVQRAFRYLIQQHVLNAKDSRSMYYNLDHPITIKTSRSNIIIKKQSDNSLVYQERLIGKFAKPIIITEDIMKEDNAALKKFIISHLNLRDKADRNDIKRALAKAFQLDSNEKNDLGYEYSTTGKKGAWSLSIKDLDKLRKKNPEKFKELFGDGSDEPPYKIGQKLKKIKGALKTKNTAQNSDNQQQSNQVQTQDGQQQDNNQSVTPSTGNTENNNQQDTNTQAATDTNNSAETSNTENASQTQTSEVSTNNTSNGTSSAATAIKAGKDKLGRERGSLSRNMEAKRKKFGNKISKTGKKIKNKIKDFGKKIWGFIKKLYRPLYNLLVYIASLLIRLVFAIGRFVVTFIVKPVLGVFMPGAGPDTIANTVNKWLSKMSDIKIKFTLTKDITAEIQQTGKIISKLLKWTAFAGCTGITIWLVSNVSKLFKSDIPNSNIVTNITPNNNSSSAEDDPFA